MRTKQNRLYVLNNRRVVALLALIITLLSAFFLFSNHVAAENSKEVNVFYTSYEVQPGDTLWTIADKYMNAECNDKKVFINKMKELNHLSNDSITAGNYIVIEYSAYSE